MEQNDNRILWVDYTRALAVFCIVLGHIVHNRTVHHFLYSFHVPLCVLLTGFCFKPKPFKTLLLSLIKKLYLPYIFFSLISILVYCMIMPYIEPDITIYLPKYIVGMLYGNAYLGIVDSANQSFMHWNMPLWYIPFLCTISLVAWPIYNKENNSAFKNLIVFVVSSIVAMIFYQNAEKKVLFFDLETAIFLFPFFSAGCLFKKIYQISKSILFKISRFQKFLLGMGGLLIGYMLYHGNNIDYVADFYGTYYLEFELRALLLSLGFIFLFQSLGNYQIWAFQYFGRNTLEVLLMHKFPIMVCTIILEKVLSDDLSRYRIW